MRNLLISIAIAGFLLGTFVLGDLSTRCEQCPPTDVVDGVFTPFGPLSVQTNEGRYSGEEKHSLEGFLALDGWITLEEYDAYVEELKEKRKKLEEREGTI